jgi:hypothetical protein
MRCGLAVSSVLVGVCSAPAMTATEIIKKVEAIEAAPYSVSRIKETVVTSTGQSREFEIKGYTLDTTDKQLQVYEKPARVRGEKILMLNGGDDIWSYSPLTRRVRHLATHMKKAKVMGSDFSYEDFAAGDYERRYTVTLEGEGKVDGKECYRLLMVPTPEGPSYTKVVAWVAQQDFVMRKVDFHDEGGLLKTLTVGEVRTIDGRATPWTMTMKNVRDGGETRIETLEMDYTTGPDPALFTQEGLKKN